MPIGLRLTYRAIVGNERTWPTSSVEDALGRTVRVARALRVVSLVPSLTEVVVAIGAGERLVGVTRYCPGVAPVVGGTKQLDLAMIEELRPDLVLANREENLERDVRRLTEAGLAVYVTYPRTLAEGIGVFGELGRLLGCAAAAELEATRCRDALAKLGVLAPRRRAACLVWREPLVAVGDDTYGGSVMAALGLDNVVTGGERRYPFLTPAELAALAPELLILPDEPYAWTADEGAAVAVAVGARPVRVDGSLLFWYGPRIARLGELAGALAAALAPKAP
jgi:ABC-type Fe3+-hydroxamate transport system substrate-binding protein